MWILIILMLVITLAGLFAGQSPGFSFQKLSRTVVLNGALLILGLFTLLFVLHNAGYFPQSVAAPFMMGIYSLAGGFFLGYAWRIYTLRMRSGTILYQHRSFWIDHAPNLLSVVLILFGIYRTSLFLEAPVTGIRFTSGMSLICFGLFTWTLKTVPEFRVNGILFLDTLISWEYVVSWSWLTETILTIDYIKALNNSSDEEFRLRELSTFIPEEDKKDIERVLKDKTNEYSDIRRNLLQPDSS